jgi:hypothetical protein
VTRLGLGLLLLVLLPAPGAAQDTVDRRGSWLSLNLGPSGAGPMAAVDVTTRRGIHGITARGLMSFRFDFFTPNAESFREAALLYGIHLGSDRVLVALRGGPSVYGYVADRFGSSGHVDVGPRMGFASEALVLGNLGTNLGVGLAMLADLNRTKNLYSLVLGLRFGDTR